MASGTQCQMATLEYTEQQILSVGESDFPSHNPSCRAKQ